MSQMIDLLGNILFPGVPSNAAYDLIKVIWKKTTNKAWEDLYLDAFQEALNQSKIFLKKYAVEGVITLNRDVLASILRQELGITIDTSSYSQLSADTFINKIAHAIEAHQVLIIAGHTLSEADYYQLILNLVRFAKVLFKEAILNNEHAFRQVVLDETLYDQALVRQLQDYLISQFGPVVLEKLTLLEGKVDDVSAGIQHIEQILTSLRYFRSLQEYLLEPGSRFPKLHDFEKNLIYLPEKYVSEIQEYLKEKRRALIVGRSAAGKTVLAIVLAKHLQGTENYTVFYGDVALAEQGDGRKWYQIIRANDRKGILYILDNCHLAPREVSEFCFQWDGSPPEHTQCVLISRPESDEAEELSDEIEDYFDRCADEKVAVESEKIYYSVLAKYAAAYQQENPNYYIALENEEASLLQEQHAHNLIASRIRLEVWRKTGGRLSEVKQEEVYKVLEQRYLSKARKTLSAICALWQYEIPVHNVFVEEVLDQIEIQHLRQQRLLTRSEVQGYGVLYELQLHAEVAREIFEANIYRQRHVINDSMVNTELVRELSAYLQTKPPNYILVYQQLRKQKQNTLWSILLTDPELQDCAAVEFEVGKISDTALYLFSLSQFDSSRAEEMFRRLVQISGIENIRSRMLEQPIEDISSSLRNLQKVSEAVVRAVVAEVDLEQIKSLATKIIASKASSVGSILESLVRLDYALLQTLIDAIDMRKLAQLMEIRILQDLYWFVRRLRDISPTQAKELLENIPIQVLITKANVSDLATVSGIILILQELEYPPDQLQLLVESIDMEQLAQRVATQSLQKLYWLIRGIIKISPKAVNQLLKAITPVGLASICRSQQMTVLEFQSLRHYLPKAFWRQFVNHFTDQDVADMAGRSSLSYTGSFFRYRLPYYKQSYALFREQYLLEKLATESIGEIAKFIYRIGQVPGEGTELAYEVLDLLIKIDLSERIASGDLMGLSLLLYTVKEIGETYLSQFVFLIDQYSIINEALSNSTIHGIQSLIYNISNLDKQYLQVLQQGLQNIDLTDKLQHADLRDIANFLWNIYVHIDSALGQKYCKLVDAQQRSDQLSKVSLDDLCRFLWNLANISNLGHLQTFNDPVIEERLRAAWVSEIGLGAELLGIIAIAGSLSKDIPFSLIETQKHKENLVHWLEQNIQEKHPHILALTLYGLRTYNESVAESVAKECLNISNASHLLKSAEEVAITPLTVALLQETFEWLKNTFADFS